MGHNLIIASKGHRTLVYQDGKVYGNGVEKVQFEHTGGEEPKIHMTTDLHLKSQLDPNNLDEFMKLVEEVLKSQ